MKHAKKLLALLLTLALTFGLAMPAMAIEQEEPAAAAAANWDGFTVDGPQDLYVPYGESYTVSVEVNMPDGVEVGYQWYQSEVFTNAGIAPVEGATAPTLRLSPGDKYYAPPYVPSYENDAGMHVQVFFCRITDKDGVHRMSSRVATVEMEGPAWVEQFRIITPPPQALYVPHGESFTLSVEVNIPDEADEVTYQWYRYRTPIAGATGPEPR